jgi:predicted PurR-regulated permease PerM
VETATLFDVEQLKATLTANWREAGGVAARVLESVTRSGLALFGWLVNLVLIPVVAFYLLRDWRELVARIDQMLPRDWAPVMRRLARESDTVLGAFMRGQLLVMLALGLFYTLGLWLVGLELALLIGMLAGLVSFVPYLGFTIGILAALLAGWFQFQEFMPLLWVVMVFGLGQLLESLWLTPRLVGESIGLHPVAVIFAIMAGGQLFGFVGVLLALPVASVSMVLLRYAHQQYLNSELYEGKD